MRFENIPLVVDVEFENRRKRISFVRLLNSLNDFRLRPTVDFPQNKCLQNESLVRFRWRLRVFNTVTNSAIPILVMMVGSWLWAD